MSQPCKYFSSGKSCPFGGNCRFLHDPNVRVSSSSSSQSKPTCKFYSQGKCRNGDSCPFLHVGKSGGQQQQQHHFSSSAIVSQDASSSPSSSLQGEAQPWYSDLQEPDTTLDLEFDEVMARARQYDDLLEQIQDMNGHISALQAQLEEKNAEIRSLREKVASLEKK